jgi:hypothetical protein
MANKSKYLIVQYYGKPNQGVRTEQAGWSDQQNSVQYDEAVTFETKLRNRYLSESSVVIDMLEKKVIKCNVVGLEEASYDKLMEYYNKYYGKQIEQFLKS